nr:S8 family peptidase [Prolixibacteraceae bacterium]
LFARNGVLGTYDFVNPGNNVYNEHYHGNAVLSIMAGNDHGFLIGSAPSASYWLLRSEDVDTESPLEEDYWIIAAEFADSVGCDVINTSLGYSTFDNKEFDHNYEQFTGNTLKISKAANMAVDKGIVVVCSAGNSGNDSWGHIVAPSEAKEVLSVAAVNNLGEIVNFSSRGFSDDGFLPKPDISAMGVGVTYASSYGGYVTGNGTSFSSPIIAGMAACLVAYYPDKTSHEIIQLIRELGDEYPNHDVAYGYGIPDFSKIIEGTSNTLLSTNLNETTIFPNPFQRTFSIFNSEGLETLELFTIEGKKVFSCKIPVNSNQISSPQLSKLKKGVYFAVLKGDQVVKSLKLMKY